MALKKAVSLPTGIQLDNAYHKVSRISIDSIRKHAMIEIITYKDQDARTNNLQTISSSSIMCDSDVYDTYFSNAILDGAGTNPIKQGYMYLKTKDVYKDATDII